MNKKVFLFLCFLLWTNGSSALNFKQHMPVQIGVFDAATIDLFYTFDKNSFDIKADVATTHVFEVFYPFLASYEAKGKVVNTDVLPVSYAAYSKTRNHVRINQIFYNDEGQAYKRIYTKDKRKKEKEITDVPLTADVADLQSVFAAFILFYKNKQSCNMGKEIYDGKKHYKISGKDGKTEMRYVDFLQKKVWAHECNITLKNLKDNQDALLDASVDRTIKLWLGLDDKTEMPFVIEIVVDSTPLGALKVTPVTLDIQ